MEHRTCFSILATWLEICERTYNLWDQFGIACLCHCLRKIEILNGWFTLICLIIWFRWNRSSMVFFIYLNTRYIYMFYFINLHVLIIKWTLKSHSLDKGLRLTIEVSRTYYKNLCEYDPAKCFTQLHMCTYDMLNKFRK